MSPIRTRSTCSPLRRERRPHPEWYRNLIAAGRGRVETGDGEYEVDVTELEGEERDRIFAEQASRYQGFAEYADKTAGNGIPADALTHELGTTRNAIYKTLYDAQRKL